MVIVAELEGLPVGFAWIDPRGAFSSAPYLRLLAVSQTTRGNGIGSRLLQEFEERTLYVGRDFCLLVSDFNERAIAFYERQGYVKSGALPDFACSGVTEILMVKKHR
jgi:ribosomal protein S18 acetylase RimI-like enzyme